MMLPGTSYRDVTAGILSAFGKSSKLDAVCLGSQEGRGFAQGASPPRRNTVPIASIVGRAKRARPNQDFAPLCGQRFPNESR